MTVELRTCLPQCGNVVTGTSAKHWEATEGISGKLWTRTRRDHAESQPSYRRRHDAPPGETRGRYPYFGIVKGREGKVAE